MNPDRVMLRGLIDASPAIRTRPGRVRPQAAIHAAESRLGPLPASWRWCPRRLRRGHGRPVDGADIATVLPSAQVGAVEDLTGRRDGDRLNFYDEGDGDSQRHARVRRYAPRWTLVGDDSGGSGLFMRPHTAPATADAPTDAYMS
ncbi:hypothetical protein [Streptomyces phaeoluteigriseus]|nr:hypothetical protein [Streptomyces phaeoluteigriseus]